MGNHQAAIEQVANVIADERVRWEVQLCAGLTNEFRLFTREQRAEYTVNAPIREEAFRHVVVREYEFSCALCRLKFQMNDLVEATAAHIVPKHVNGTDDPRNGVALCRTHHWAFDSGLFALGDRYEILVSPTVERAKTVNFDLPEYAGESILLPTNQILRPHAEALAWHRQNVLRT